MIALYRGTSGLSKAIRFINWSDYSHAAYIDVDTTEVFEAWKGGVRKVANLSDQHDPGTEVDLFVVEATPEQNQAVKKFLVSQVGKGYDYAAIMGFLIRRDEAPEDQTKWFCSELVFAAYQSAGIDLLARIPRWKVYPGMLAYSPLLKVAGSITTQ